jgi:hypothetical protein
VLERSTYVPALNDASFNGGDDFLGSARERLFGFINGQTGADNPQAQGFVHLIKDGHASEDASAANTTLINATSCATAATSSTCSVTSQPWPTPGMPTPTARCGTRSSASGPRKAIAAGLDKRQIDEYVVFNLAATRPDLLTGPHGAPFGSAGVDINGAVIGFTAKAPTANLVAPVPNSPFPPR